MMEHKLNIKGMTCGGCAASVKGALENVAGVEKVEVDLASGSAKVNAPQSTTADDLIRAVINAGYEAAV